MVDKSSWVEQFHVRKDQLAFVNQTVFLSGYSTVSFDNADLRRTAIILVIFGLCFDNYR